MNVFLTGITGNIGSAVARRLLDDEATHIWPLIRADSDQRLQQRLTDMLDVWQLSPTAQQDVVSRIHPVRGDMGSVRFGLSAKDWSNIVGQCDALIHAAGVVRMNLPITEARRIAVGSAKNVIMLADEIASARRVHVAFVSTVGVAGRQSEPLTDDWITQPRDFHNSYEQAKAEAEDMLRHWRPGDHIQLNIHRPSMVVGGSDGEWLRHQVFYYLCEFLSGRHTKGLQPDLAGMRLDTVPIDYVADAVVWATRKHSNRPFFNLCSGPDLEVALSDVQRWVHAALTESAVTFPRTRSLSPRAFIATIRVLSLFAPRAAKRRLATLPVLLDYLHSPQTFDGRATQAFLQSEAGIVLPEPSIYLPQVIARYYR